MACCVSWMPAPFALRRTSFFNAFFSLATHVLRPRLHLVPHRRFRGAAVGRGLDHAIVFQVAPHMAGEGHPLSGGRREALGGFSEIFQGGGVGLCWGGGYQGVISGRAPGDWGGGGPPGGEDND